MQVATPEDLKHSNNSHLLLLPNELQYYHSSRIKKLAHNNITVVLADGVHKFLENSSKIFQLYVCSLGITSYVQDIVDVLNNGKNYIAKENAFSARALFDQLRQQTGSSRAKDLRRILPYCVKAGVLWLLMLVIAR